jgi:hypothetical protein
LTGCVEFYKTAHFARFHRGKCQNRHNMKQPNTTVQNPANGKEVAKQSSRFSAGFWQNRIFRPKYKSKDSKD